MNPYLLVILAALLGRYLLDLVSDWLNVRNIAESLPTEFQGYYDAEAYRRSQRYLRDNTRFGLIADTVQTAVTLAVVLGGGFNLVDQLARSCHAGPILTGLVFTGIIIVASTLLSLPFSVYRTFVIEERYGFNKTTPRTFVLDLFKSLALAAAIGGPLFAAVLWFFGNFETTAWIYCWAIMTAAQILLVFAAPYVIMPLFNKFVPLEQGDLRAAIEGYATAQKFTIRGVFTMDGSKRSSKSNAFFTGFGRSRRIVLFDTLIEKHTVPELLAIVAHEMGHYKKKHIPQGMLRSVLTTGLSFFLLSLFIGNEGLFKAFRMEYEPTIYGSLFFFGFLYTPIGMALSIAGGMVSRKHEYQADAFAAETTGSAEPMVTALKKLSVDNLTDLTPHPLKVILAYSHPPVLERIRALNRSTSGTTAGRPAERGSR